MSATLVISGSLATRSLRAVLDRGRCEVLEFDTLLDRGKFPQVSRWMSVRELTDPEMAAAIDATVKGWTEILFGYPSPAGLPLSRDFRMASFGVAELVCLMTAASNLHLGERILADGSFSGIVVSAGCGVSFPIWRQLATQQGLPLEILPIQRHRRTVWRLLTKKRLRAQQRRIAAPLLGKALPLADVPISAAMLCCSRAVGEILLKQGSTGIVVADAKDLVKADSAEVAAHRAVFGAWWSGVSLAGLGSGVAEILSQVGGGLARDTYPLHVGIHRRALAILREKRPRSVLCDTQRGAAERMWALAARELGIPVIAYTYDHLLERDYFFTPDRIVSDSGRNTRNAVAQGVAPENIVEAASHRLPHIQRRPGPRRLVVAADNFYSGDQCTQDPQVSYHLYQKLTAAARSMPDVEFVLKFHPLRQKKSALRSFTGMDEQELANRKAHIRALDPPRNFRTAEPEESMLALLERADALVNIESLTGVEAFRAGIPVVFLRPPVAQDFPRLADYGAACVPDDAGDLAAKLRRLLTDVEFRGELVGNQRRYAQEFYWKSTTPLAEAALSFVEP